jgi:hypothetical protein
LDPVLYVCIFALRLLFLVLLLFFLFLLLFVLFFSRNSIKYKTAVYTSAYNSTSQKWVHCLRLVYNVIDSLIFANSSCFALSWRCRMSTNM